MRRPAPLHCPEQNPPERPGGRQPARQITVPVLAPCIAEGRPLDFRPLGDGDLFLGPGQGVASAAALFREDLFSRCRGSGLLFGGGVLFGGRLGRFRGRSLWRCPGFGLRRSGAARSGGEENPSNGNGEDECDGIKTVRVNETASVLGLWAGCRRANGEMREGHFFPIWRISAASCRGRDSGSQDRPGRSSR